MKYIVLRVALAFSILSLCNGYRNSTTNETSEVLNNGLLKIFGERDISGIVNEKNNKTISNTGRFSPDKRSDAKLSSANNASNEDNYVSGLTQQIFKNIDGYQVKDIFIAPSYPDSPDEQNAIPNIDVAPSSYKGLTNFGERIFGYFKAPQDGEYQFNISSNNNGQLMISTNTDKANLRTYAEVKGQVIANYGEFDRFDKQGSMPVPMKAGEMYYLQVLHKSLFGLNHVQIGALFPDKTKHFPLEPQYFFTLKDMKKEGEVSDGNGDSSSSSSSGGDGGGGAGGGSSGNNSSNAADPLQAALDAGLKAGIENGAEAGSKAGENAGKRAGEDAGAKAGAEAGLQAAANALGISVEQLKAQKAEREANKKLGFKFRFYSANFKCSQPGGYVCKYAISAEEDNTVHLNPRESASTFILRKPGLNGKIGSASFELDYRRGVFLKKDGTVLTVGANDGSKQFAKSASFSIDSQNNIFPATYGIRLHDNPDVYVCHTIGTSEVVVDKLSDNCAFFMVPIELDMNTFQPSCKDFCQQEENPTVQSSKPVEPSAVPTNKKEATIETLHLLDALARHAASVATEKTVQDRIANERIAAIARLQAEHKLKADSHFFENLHYEHDEGQRLHGQQYITVHFRNKAGPPGKIRIKSSIKPEGYLLGEDTFKLRIVFKHQFLSEVTFSGVDEREKPQIILLDGQKELKITPSFNPTDMKDVVVTAVPDSPTNGHSVANLRSISDVLNSAATSPYKPIDDHQAKKNLSSELNLKDITPWPDVYEIAYDQDIGQKKGNIASLASSIKTKKNIIRKFNMIPVSNTGRFYFHKPEIKLNQTSAIPNEKASDGIFLNAAGLSLPMINLSKSYESLKEPHFDDSDSDILTDEPDEEIAEKKGNENEASVIKKAFVDETVFSDNLLNEKVETKDNEIAEAENLSDEIFPLEDNSDERLLRDYSLSRDYHSVKNITEALNDHVVKDPDLMENILKKKETSKDHINLDVDKDKQDFLNTRNDLSSTGSGLGEHSVVFNDSPDLTESQFNKRGHYPNYVDILLSTSKHDEEVDGRELQGKLKHDMSLHHNLMALKNVSLNSINFIRSDSDAAKQNLKVKSLPTSFVDKTEEIQRIHESESESFLGREQSYSVVNITNSFQKEKSKQKSFNQTLNFQSQEKNVEKKTDPIKYIKSINESEKSEDHQSSMENKDQIDESKTKDIFLKNYKSKNLTDKVQNLSKVQTISDAQGIIKDLKQFLNTFKNSSPQINNDSAYTFSVKNVLNSIELNKQTENKSGSKSIPKAKFVDILNKLEENNYRAKLKSLSEFLRRYTVNDENQRRRYEAWQSKHNLPMSWYYATPITGFRRSFGYNQQIPFKNQSLNKNMIHRYVNAYKDQMPHASNLTRRSQIRVYPHMNLMQRKSLLPLRIPPISTAWPRFNIFRPKLKAQNFNYKPPKLVYSNKKKLFMKNPMVKPMMKPIVKPFYNRNTFLPVPIKSSTMFFNPYLMPVNNYWHEMNNYYRNNLKNSFLFNNKNIESSNKNLKMFYNLKPANILPSIFPLKRNGFAPKLRYRGRRETDKKLGELVNEDQDFTVHFSNVKESTAPTEVHLVHEPDGIFELQHKSLMGDPIIVSDNANLWSPSEINKISVNLHDQILNFVEKKKGTGLKSEEGLPHLFSRKLFTRSTIPSPLFLGKIKPLNLHTKNYFPQKTSDNIKQKKSKSQKTNLKNETSLFKRVIFPNVTHEWVVPMLKPYAKNIFSTTNQLNKALDKNVYYIENLKPKNQHVSAENQKTRNHVNKGNDKNLLSENMIKHHHVIGLEELKKLVRLSFGKSHNLKQSISKRSHMISHNEKRTDVIPQHQFTSKNRLSIIKNFINKKISSVLPKQNYHLTDQQKYKEINDFLGQKLYNQNLTPQNYQMSGINQLHIERSSVSLKQTRKKNLLKGPNKFVRAFSNSSSIQQAPVKKFRNVQGNRFSSFIQPLFRNNFQYSAKTNPIFKNQVASMNSVPANRMMYKENTPKRDLAFQTFMKQNQYLAAYLAAFYKKNPLYFRSLNNKYYFNNMSPEQYELYVNKFVEPLYPNVRWRIANYMLADYFIRNGYPIGHLGSIYGSSSLNNVIHDYRTYKQITPAPNLYPPQHANDLYNSYNNAYFPQYSAPKYTNMYAPKYTSAYTQGYSNAYAPKYTNTNNNHQINVNPGINWQTSYLLPSYPINHIHKSYLPKASSKFQKRLLHQSRMYIPKRYVFPAKLIEDDSSRNNLEFSKFRKTVNGNKRSFVKGRSNPSVKKNISRSVIGNINKDAKLVHAYDEINSSIIYKNEISSDINDLSKSSPGNKTAVIKLSKHNNKPISTKTRNKTEGSKIINVLSMKDNSRETPFKAKTFQTATLKRSNMLNNPKIFSTADNKLELNSSSLNNISTNGAEVKDPSKNQSYTDDISMQDLLIIEKMFDTAQAFFMSENRNAKRNKSSKMVDSNSLNNQKLSPSFVTQSSGKTPKEISVSLPSNLKTSISVIVPKSVNSSKMLQYQVKSNRNVEPVKITLLNDTRLPAGKNQPTFRFGFNNGFQKVSTLKEKVLQGKFNKSNEFLSSELEVKKETHLNKSINKSTNSSRTDVTQSDQHNINRVNHDKIKVDKNQSTFGIFLKKNTTINQNHTESELTHNTQQQQNQNKQNKTKSHQQSYNTDELKLQHHQNDYDEATAELEDAKEALENKNESDDQAIKVNMHPQYHNISGSGDVVYTNSEHVETQQSNQNEELPFKPTEKMNLEVQKNSSAFLTPITKDDGKLDDLHQTLDLDRLLKSYDSDPSHDISNEDWFESTFRPDATTKLDLKITTSKFLNDIKRKHKHVASPTGKQQVNNIVKMAESSEQKELQNLIKESIGNGINNEMNPALGLGSSDKASLEKTRKILDNEAAPDVDSSNIEGLKAAEITNNEIGKLVGDLTNDFELGEKDSNGFFDDAVEKGDVINQIKFEDQKEVHDLKLDLAGDSNPKPFPFIDSKRNKKTSKALSVENINQAFDNAALSKDSLVVDKGIGIRHEENPVQAFLSVGDKFAENTRTSEQTLVKNREGNFRKNSLENKSQLMDLDGLREKWREVNEQHRKTVNDKTEDLSLTTADETARDYPIAETDKNDLLDNYFKEVEKSQHDLKGNFEKEFNQRQSKRKQKIQVTLAMINDIEKQIDTIMNSTETNRKKKKKGKEAIFNELVHGTQKKVLEDVNSATRNNKLDNLEEVNSRSKKSNKLTVSGKSKDESLFIDKANSHDLSDVNKHSLDIASMVASNDRKERFQQAQALFKIQKDEANEDLLKLKEITQDGLQSMFAKAVAKQQKFMDDVQGPPASVLETQGSMHQDFENNKLISMESVALDSPSVTNSLSFSSPPRLWRPLDDDDYITEEDEPPARKNLVLDEDQYNKQDGINPSDKYQDKVINDDDVDDDDDEPADNDNQNDGYLIEKGDQET